MRLWGDEGRENGVQDQTDEAKHSGSPSPPILESFPKTKWKEIGKTIFQRLFTNAI